MGNLLSSFLSGLLMDMIQNDLHSEDLPPKIWISYIDDIFTITHKKKMEKTPEVLSKVSFDSYRKPAHAHNE